MQGLTNKTVSVRYNQIKALTVRFSTLVAFAGFATLAAATPVPDGSDSGTYDCCAHVGSASDPVIAVVLDTLGIVLNDVDGLIGVGCIPITIIGVGSTTAW